jgi:Cu/Ag efflux protein CusF
MPPRRSGWRRSAQNPVPGRRDVTQVTATVKKIDLKRHKATLEFPDGSTETFPVRKDVDLNGRKVGEKVSLRTIESVAISVERP